MASRASIGEHPIHPMLIGVVGLSIAGYLGGELVFRHGVAVDVQISAPAKTETTNRARAA